jgi:hypothetical protein
MLLHSKKGGGVNTLDEFIQMIENEKYHKQKNNTHKSDILA